MEYIVQFNEFGNPIRRSVGMSEVRILVDAGTGYGWRLDGRVRMHEFGVGLKAVASDWAEIGELEFARCWKELKALQYYIEAECESLAGKAVLVRPDASTSVAYVNKGSGSSRMLTMTMRNIWNVCVKHSIALYAEHLKGDKVIVTGADSLSRWQSSQWHFQFSGISTGWMGLVGVEVTEGTVSTSILPRKPRNVACGQRGMQQMVRQGMHG